MNPIQILSDTNTEGEVTIKTVPNQVGTVLVYTGDKKVSTRTNAQIISDLGLIGALNIAANYYNKTESDLRFEPKIPTGTSLQYIRGDKTLGFFPEYTFSDGLTDNFGNITPLYGTTAGTVAEGNILDTLKIGSRNLIINSNTILESNNYYVGNLYSVEDLIVGKQYTIRFKTTFNPSQKLYFGNAPSINPIAIIDSLGDGIYEATFIFALNPSYPTDVSNMFVVYNYPYGGNHTGKILSVKLEKGNKATDWSPAPEDQIADWNTTNVNDFSFIKNKPDLPTVLGNYVSKTGDAMTGILYSNSTISVVSEGEGHDPYGRIGVTRGTVSNFAYYGLTRAGQIGWSLGIDTNNRFIIGVGATTSDKIIANTSLSLDQSGNVIASSYIASIPGGSTQGGQILRDVYTGEHHFMSFGFERSSGNPYWARGYKQNGIDGVYKSTHEIPWIRNGIHLTNTGLVYKEAPTQTTGFGSSVTDLVDYDIWTSKNFTQTNINNWNTAVNNYVTKANVNENINGEKSFLKRTFIWERLGMKNLAGVEKIILNSELSRIVVRQPDTSSEIALFAWGKSTDAASYPSFQLPPTASRLAIGCYIDAYNGYNLLIGGSARVDQAMDAGLLRKIGSNDDEILRGAGDVAKTDKEIQIESGALRFVPEEFKFYSDGEVDTNRALVHVVIYDTTYNIDFRSASARQTYKIWNLSSNSCFMNIGAGFSISRYTMVEIYISDNGDKIITNEVRIGTL